MKTKTRLQELSPLSKKELLARLLEAEQNDRNSRELLYELRREMELGFVKEKVLKDTIEKQSRVITNLKQLVEQLGGALAIAGECIAHIDYSNKKEESQS